jgi:phosphohistidine phosphatase
MNIVTQQLDDCSNLMIVGHNPGMTDLVNQLLPEFALDNLPTGGVVAMESDTDYWAHFGDARVDLVYYDYPKNPEVLLIEY